MHKFGIVNLCTMLLLQADSRPPAFCERYYIEQMFECQAKKYRLVKLAEIALIHKVERI